MLALKTGWAKFLQIKKKLNIARELVVNRSKSGWPGSSISGEQGNRHCKHTVAKIQNNYSQKWNCAASFPIPSFMYL
jgi:hypothetical protein